MIAFATGILTESWKLLVEAAPFVLFGFLAAGLLKALIPEDFVARHLGRSTSGSVIKASLLGIPLPLCSCGVIPAAIGLRKQGASKGASAAFLISTPESGVDSIAITWALLDPIMTISPARGSTDYRNHHRAAYQPVARGSCQHPGLRRGRKGGDLSGSMLQ